MIRRTRPTFVPPRARAGFTLPELLVVMLVTIILMSIVVGATSLGGQISGESRAKGRLMDQQRVAMSVLTRDLQLPHFLDENKSRLRVSDYRTDQLRIDPATKRIAGFDASGRPTGFKPPRGGYFLAYSPPVDANPTSPLSTNFYEGADGDGFDSSRSGNHFVQFTIIVPGGAPQDTLTADVPYLNSPSTTAYPITFHAAEVAYFLVDSGRKTPGGVKLYDLIRRQRGCAMNQYDAPEYAKLLNNIPTTGPAPTMAKDDPIQVVAAFDQNATSPPNTGPAKYKVSSLTDLTLSANRFGNAAVPYSAPYAPINTLRVGDDVLLTNVTSFELKYTGPQANVTWTAQGASDPKSFTWPRPFVPPPSPSPPQPNSDYPHDSLPFDGYFDTFHQLRSPQAPLDWDDAQNLAPNRITPPGVQIGALKPIRITGVLIRLRCWDPKSKSSRQTTREVNL